MLHSKSTTFSFYSSFLVFWRCGSSKKSLELVTLRRYFSNLEGSAVRSWFEDLNAEKHINWQLSWVVQKCKVIGLHNGTKLYILFNWSYRSSLFFFLVYYFVLVFPPLWLHVIRPEQAWGDDEALFQPISWKRPFRSWARRPLLVMWCQLLLEKLNVLVS